MKTKKTLIYEFINSEEYRPVGLKDMSKLLGVPKHEIAILEEVLKQLEDEGKIVRTKNGKYMTIEKAGFVVGKFQGHEKGFGFVIREEGDIFIPARATGGALNKDLVLCEIIKEKSERSAEGEVVRILERGKEKIVGTYHQNKNFGFVVPDDVKLGTDIYIPKGMSKSAVDGHKVVVKITEWLEDRKNPDGEVIEIIGHKDDPGVDIMSIIKDFDLSVEFPNKVYKQIENIPLEVQEEEMKDRLDLRDVKMVTIDGEDAKDLDDAVSLEKLDNGHYKLGVHIADVTNYVKEGTPLDQEALKRATSVYLVDRVIPMLPHKLSNGICSLNAGVDRLALSCIMEIDKAGKVLNHKIAQTLIKVDRRMTYTNVYKILNENDKELIEDYADFVDMFKEMRELAEILTKKRYERGALDFDTEEVKIKLDEKGKVVEIKKYDRNTATRIIEEFMLVCNETVAENAFWQETPFVYRSHEDPDDERVETFLEFIKGIGYNVKSKQKVHPKELQRILEEVKGKPEERIVSRLMLRSMKQARYTPTNDGHYGLAAEYYCHFTSPIRRYPDLQIHRIIKENLNKGLSDKRRDGLKARTTEVAEISSIQERVAEEVERETEDLKKAEYMLDKVGEVFDGNISGLTNWGIYVELANTIEGLVRLADLNDDYYVFDEKKYIIIGERTKKIFRLGDPVKVLVARVSVENREIDFMLMKEEEEKELVASGVEKEDIDG